MHVLVESAAVPQVDLLEHEGEFEHGLENASWKSGHSQKCRAMSLLEGKTFGLEQ